MKPTPPTTEQIFDSVNKKVIAWENLKPRASKGYYSHEEIARYNNIIVRAGISFGKNFAPSDEAENLFAQEGYYLSDKMYVFLMYFMRQYGRRMGYRSLIDKIHTVNDLLLMLREQ